MERIPLTVDDAARYERHFYRYRWAAERLQPGDIVLDCACGTGYAQAFLPDTCTWIGVDRLPPKHLSQISADLRAWDGWQRMRYDVAISLETIEHLDELDNLVALLKHARRSIVLSTPIVPTTHFNEFHVRDFTVDQIEELFVDEAWRVARFEIQAKIYGLWEFLKDV